MSFEHFLPDVHSIFISKIHVLMYFSSCLKMMEGINYCTASAEGTWVHKRSNKPKSLEIDETYRHYLRM